MQAKLYESVSLRRVDPTLVLVAFGANLPSLGLSLAETLVAAQQAVVKAGFSDRGFSHLYRTPCFPAGAGPDYINACGAFSAAPDMSPRQILAVLHRIEADFGRERGVRWGARTLDLDLLAVGDRVLPDDAEQDRWRALPPDQQARIAPDALILPHPRMQDRGFVLVPLADVAPDWVHPRLGLTVRQMCDALPPEARAEVARL